MDQQVQKTNASPETGGGRGIGAALPRLLPCVLLGLGATGMLTLLLVFGILFPFHFLAQLTLFLLLAIPEFLVFTAIFYSLARPWAIIRYLRTVHGAQRSYHDLYTPLTTLTNIRTTTDLTQAHDSDEPVQHNEYISLLQLVEHQQTPLLVLGVPGAGKTMALRAYQYLTSEQPFKIATTRGKIPIYVPMKNYSLYLKQLQAETLLVNADFQHEALSPSLLSYLVQSDLPGMRYLHSYIIPLFKQGLLLFLCDGLNEVDSDYLTQVSAELAAIMSTSQNRLVITCREVDYREQPDFVELVEDGRAARVVVYPLQLEQVYAFVERYVEQQSDQWRHTAGQIMTVIDRSRLRYHCTNPMMLFTLMGIIDKIGVEYGKLIDTRGLLLRESVSQLIAQEVDKWDGAAPAEQDIIRFLSDVACAARWAQDRNAIQLTAPARVGLTAQRGSRNIEIIRAELESWLQEHRAQGPFVVEHEPELASYGDTVPLLRFAQSAGLIDISSDGVLSFRHELIAEYLVAEYFLACEPGALDNLTIREELLEDVGRWSEPVAIWAGLLDDPLELAECFGRLGVNKQTYVLQALTLGLICVGVLWTPPQAEVPHYVELPPAIGEALSIAVQNKAAREELAQLFTHSAEEGGLEVYRSLLPLVTLDGIEELIVLLDRQVVPDLLFTQLQDSIRNPAYEQQVKRIVRVLGLFGAVVVPRASELSLPAPERSLRLRAAAVNTLGGTNDVSAVEPLMERLQDSEMFIAQRATNALIRLGPQLTLTRVLEELETQANKPFASRVHQAILTIVDRFLEDKDVTKYQVSPAQYQQILGHAVPMLSGDYQSEPETQQIAREFLVKQARMPVAVALHEKRSEKAIDALLGYVASEDAVAVRNVLLALQEIGAPAVPRLIERLNDPAESVRVRVVDILVDQRDFRALDALLRLLSDSQATVRQHAMRALEVYAPESIPGLVEIILTGPDDMVADRAATVLETIGVATIDPVIEALASAISARTRFLVQVLEKQRDPRAIPALISLLAQPQLPQAEPLLAVSIIRALCLFSDARVVQPLLNLLSVSNTLVYEQAIMALSQLGMLAFDELVLALEQPAEPAVIQRIRRALILMAPFPGEQLIGVLEQRRSAHQADQVVAILRDKGQEAAQVLVANLLHQDESVREYVQQTLEQMSGTVVVPALLDALYRPELRQIVSALLLRYPDAAMPPLVGLLGEHERSTIAADLLPRFGAAVLRPLVAGLNDQRASARELSQYVIISLARQRQGQDQQQILLEIVHLFHPTLPPYAREALLDLLTETVADVSMPALMDGLEDARLIEDVAEAFVRLARKPELQNAVLDNLIGALFVDEQRRGAEIALIRNGGLVVARVGELIVNANAAVARSAQFILGEIGIPALSFIWTAQSDRSNLTRREAAMAVFRSMPPEVIKDELVTLLVGDDRDDIAMAVSLLLARVHEEAKLDYQEHVMVPELIDFVQTSTQAETNLRIMALLLLMGEQTIRDHLIQALRDDPQQSRNLLYLFFLLGPSTQYVLLKIFNDSLTPLSLRAEVATILSMTSVPEAINDYVYTISRHGIANKRAGGAYPEQLAVSLRALGGLLASGQWDVDKLQELREDEDDEGALREIANVLLGWRYEPQLTKLQQDLAIQRDTFKKELLVSTMKMAEQQNRISSLESEIESIREEQGVSDDTIKKIMREKEALSANVSKLTRDNRLLQLEHDRLERERRDLTIENQSLQRQQGPVRGSGSQHPQIR